MLYTVFRGLLPVLLNAVVALLLGKLLAFTGYSLV